MSQDLSGFSLWDLYRAEVESHAATLTDGLLALEQQPADVDRIKALMRAAHSIKGAARVVQHAVAVQVAHAMEDRLVAAQAGRSPLGPDDLQCLLDGVDLLVRLSPADEGQKGQAIEGARADADRLVAALTAVAGHEAPVPARDSAPAAPPADGPGAPAPPRAGSGTSASAAPPAGSASGVPGEPAAVASPAPDRAIRLTAQTVTRLMGLVSEAVVGTRWLAPFGSQLLAVKRRLSEVSVAVDHLERQLEALDADGDTSAAVNDLQDRLERTRADLTEQLAALDRFSLRQDTLSAKLYREVLATRMRPFGDLAEGFPRLVRDVSKQLGKRVKLEIDGKATEVDREVAALLEAPLVHLIRNAVDHGIEAPEARVAAGKPDIGTVRVSAHHRAGMLRVQVEDDGCGADAEALRARILDKGLADPAMVARMSEAEVLEFLFLPGFSTAARVTEISGRGVGLDVALDAVKRIGGRAQLVNRPGQGFLARLELPVTLSVLQALVAEVAGEPYALPLTRVERVAAVSRADIRRVEGREFLTIRLPRPATPGSTPHDAVLEDCHVGLVSARQVLGLPGDGAAAPEVPVVVVGDRDHFYGLAVDRIVGEQFVVVRPLDGRLGKVPDIGAAAITLDGTPLLVLDLDDVVRSIEQILTGGRLTRVGERGPGVAAARKRILLVDDSITVREVERKLLEAAGYAVEVAVDGADGWNAVRTGRYDLVVSDVDMPRLDGIELVRLIRADRRFATLPVMIVSYKDREEDRLRGLDAGASYYLPKASFQDDTFLKAVDELVGDAEGA